MRFLDFLFPEKKWERTVVEALTNNWIAHYGFTREDAMQQARASCAVAIAACKANRTSLLPLNFGDILVGDARAKDDFTADVAQRLRPRMELLFHKGATAVDIRDYWNGPAFWRLAAENQDQAMRLASFTIAKQEWGMEDGAAALWVKREHVVYGYSMEVLAGTLPVPWELRARVNRHLQERTASDKPALTAEVRSYGTVNDYVWAMIAKGKL